MGGFTFRANTGNIQVLSQLRQNRPLLLSLANNHTINGGYEGITTTKQLLNEHQILSVGAGITPDEAKTIVEYRIP
jgi:hypothetical protein